MDQATLWYKLFPILVKRRNYQEYLKLFDKTLNITSCVNTHAGACAGSRELPAGSAASAS